MSKMVRVCGNSIQVEIKKDGWLGGTRRIKTICGRPPNHTKGNCAPGPTKEDLLSETSWW
jgi:hypothetical protein